MNSIHCKYVQLKYSGNACKTSVNCNSAVLVATAECQHCSRSSLEVVVLAVEIFAVQLLNSKYILGWLCKLTPSKKV